MRRTVKILSLVLAVLLFVSISEVYLFRSNITDDLRIEGFRLEERNSLDVVLLGSSEIFTAFAPPYAWQLQGITSYPYGVSAGPATYWITMLEDILSRQNPQLIVVETNGAVYDADNLHSNAPLHYILDYMPMNANKLQALNSLVTEETDEKEAFLFPIVKYHSFWSDPETLRSNFNNIRDQHKRGHTMLRGIWVSNSIEGPNMPPRDLKQDYSKQSLDEGAERALREFLEYCQAKKLPVLFTCFPHQITTEDNRIYRNFQRTNTIEEIVKEYGFPYLNLERLIQEIGLDPAHDYYNEGHLNIYGQRKFTEFFSQYLAEECGVTPGNHTQAQKDSWDESAEYYSLLMHYMEEIDAKDSSRGETRWLVKTLEQTKAS